MRLTRTTLRIDTNLKRAAEKRARDDDTTLQAVFNKALQQYLDKQAKQSAVRIVFKTHDLGVVTDKLDRSDFYQ